MTEGSRMIDEFTELLERHDAAEVRLVRARGEQPLACALVMAALCWDRLDRRGWRTPEALRAQARRLMAGWRMGAEAVDDVDDADQVSAALEWATRDPALLERDGQGSYRSVSGVVLPVGSRFWRECHRAAVAAGVLTPLELVIKGDDERDANPADFDAAEVSYQLAIDGDDPDAAALASLRLAELAELREQPAPAAHQYAEVAALRHPVASPPAVLWLARRAAEDGDADAARALAQEVVKTGYGSLRAEAWGLVGSLAWQDKDADTAVAALRHAVEEAGEWHATYSRCLAEMLVGRGELAGAIEVYRRLLDQLLLYAPDIERYLQLMIATGRGDEAVTVLEQYAAHEGPFAGEWLLALASTHAARDDLDAMRAALARIRAHWSMVLPQISVRAEMMEASVAAADGDDERAAQLYRSLTDTDDTRRRDLARPLLIAAGEHLAKQGRVCLIPGARPLLEYLSEVAAPENAVWAANSLAHLATIEGRADDAEVAVRMVARHRSPDEVTVLRALLRNRAGHGREAIAYLIDAAVAALPPALLVLLPAIADFSRRSHWPDNQQRPRLRTAVDQALAAEESEGIRDQIAMAMAQVEMNVCLNRDRAIALWQRVTASDDRPLAASAWFNIGITQHLWAPITAAYAFEQAMLLDDTTAIGGRAALELAELAERLGDNPVLARACTRALELTSGEDRAQASLRLGRINHHRDPDNAEDAYQAAIAEPGAHPATIGAALARLGALYSRHGHRRLAERTRRRGRNHRDPRVAEAFAAECAAIGRVRRISSDASVWTPKQGG